MTLFQCCPTNTQHQKEIQDLEVSTEVEQHQGIHEIEDHWMQKMQQYRTRSPWWAYYRCQTARAGSVIAMMSWCGFGDIIPLFNTKLLTVNFDRYHSLFLKMNRRQSSLSLYFLVAVLLTFLA